MATSEAIEVYKAWRAKNAANLPTGVNLGWRGDEAYATRVLQLNGGGCVIVNKASGEILAEVAGESARKTASLSPVIQGGNSIDLCTLGVIFCPYSFLQSLAYLCDFQDFKVD